MLCLEFIYRTLASCPGAQSVDIPTQSMSPQGGTSVIWIRPKKRFRRNDNFSSASTEVGHKSINMTLSHRTGPWSTFSGGSTQMSVRTKSNGIHELSKSPLPHTLTKGIRRKISAHWLLLNELHLRPAFVQITETSIPKNFKSFPDSVARRPQSHSLALVKWNVLR